MSKAVEVFTDIYKRRVWGDGSGGGSVHSKPYIDYVNAMIAKHRPKVVFDIGCGDMVVASKFNLQGAKYIGWDASTFYAEEEQTGQHEIHDGKDALTDELPEADMMLCKEVLQHLSNAQVQTLLDRTSHYPTRIFCNSFDDEGHPLKRNSDIEMGDHRPVDLSQYPFMIPNWDNVWFGPDKAQYIIQAIYR